MLSRFRCVAVLLLCLLPMALLPARQFHVMAYNVENLFDADGVALFGDYQPGNPANPSPYSPRKLLTKIQNIAELARRFNDGAGPEVILFQELELDRTPGSTVEDYHVFLELYADTSVDEMLTGGFNEEIAGLPVEALLLKYFHDNGLTGYTVALPEHTEPLDQRPAHTNAVFTKFPITYAKTHHTPRARAIQEVGLDVDGNEFIVFNNHWKSGASHARTESVRVRNARDLRSALEAVIARNPSADILIGGDLNTNYNAKQYFPTAQASTWHDTEDFAIDVLGSQGDEQATRQGDRLLYNLWFELPVWQRGSELYQGGWSTLMHMLVTPGMFDTQGIRYVDDSFCIIAVPGLNARGPWNAPIPWYFTSDTGGGHSDHFPIAAIFTTDHDTPLNEPSHRSPNGPAAIPMVNFRDVNITAIPHFTDLPDANPETLAANFGNLYVVEGKLVQTRPYIIRVGEQHFQVYAYGGAVKDRLAKVKVGHPLRFIGQLDEYRGQPQFVVHDADWLR